MTMDKKGTYSPASDTTSYQSENDPYGIKKRTHDVFVPPQVEDTSYGGTGENAEADCPTPGQKPAEKTCQAETTAPPEPQTGCRNRYYFCLFCLAYPAISSHSFWNRHH